jgi:hypothetical protein
MKRDAARARGVPERQWRDPGARCTWRPLRPTTAADLPA